MEVKGRGAGIPGHLSIPAWLAELTIGLTGRSKRDVTARYIMQYGQDT